jgi:tRNA pseudouridine38-40 synthase
MNEVLPPDIVVKDRKAVSVDFHALKSAKKKAYVYYLLISPYKNPFIEDKVWRLTKPLDEQALQKALNYLIGQHDFSAFCASDSKVKSKIRHIHSIKITKQAPSAFFKLKGEKYLCLEFVGSGFLKQMVRNITGTLVRVGQDKLKPVDIKKILQSKDRKQASLTAPARGLYLKKVWY